MSYLKSHKTNANATSYTTVIETYKALASGEDVLDERNDDGGAYESQVQPSINSCPGFQ
jgi:hypothetical protein